MQVVWGVLVTIVIAVINITLSHIIRSRAVTVNPDVVRVDQSIFQIMNDNTQLTTIVTNLQAQIADISNNINILTTTKNNLTTTLAAIIADQIQQVVILEPHEVDSELLLLVNLRTDILTYMDIHFTPGISYVKTSTLYQAIDTFISDYLNVTTLSLAEFIIAINDANALTFRNILDTIYNNTLPYNFDSFYTDLTNAL